MDSVTYGNVKHPPYWDRTIPNSENMAWDDLGQRRAVGVCQHSMVGSLSGTDGWFRRGAASTGLTDYGIGGSTDGANDGVIYKWNNPIGRRAGWANGGSNGLEGDGPLFVRTLGVNAINRDLVSIERSDGGDTTTPMSPKQFEAICALTAYWFDQAEVPYDLFPVHPKFDIVTHLLHFEFATKTCPHHPVTSRIDEIQNRIRAILKAGQSAGTEPTVPPVIPANPDHSKWPYPLDQLKARFGSVPIRQLDGTMKLAPFSEKGAISNAWVARAKKDGIKKVADIPPPLQGFEAVDKDGLQQTIITFDGRGKGVWVLFRPAREVSFRWLT